jgi:hypothetical protein
MAEDPRAEEVAAAERRVTHLVVAGVDAVYSPERGWVVLEVNDHPSGLAAADAGGCGAAGHGVVRSVALALARRAGEDCVGLLLPEAFRVGMAGAQNVASADVAWSDTRATNAIADFNALAQELRRLGTPVAITDVDRVRMDGADVVLDGEKRVGALYRRSSSFPPRQPRCACVNDLRVRAICPDKKRTATLLEAAGVPVPRAIRGSADVTPWVIGKPNFGSASAGVVRIQAADPALAPLLRRRRRAVVQEWIEPATTRLRRRRHYFDVRVLVVDGKVVGHVARVAAAPFDEPVFAASPLAWLTTTGRPRPLRAARRSGAVSLPQAQLDALDALCVRVVRTLDVAARGLEYAAALRSIPSFGTLAGIRGPLRPIELQAT